MPRLASIVDYQRLVPSPSAGRLPSDPYYLLRRQAELNARARAVSKPFPAPQIQSPGRYADVWTARNRATVVQAGRAAATVALRPGRGRVVTRPAPVAPNPSPPAVVPERPAVDSIVEAEQAENEAWLKVAAPRAAVEFKLASKRLEEARSIEGYERSALLAQALESLRRAMGRLADGVCPPRSGPVHDRLGKECPTHDRAHKARINLALQEATNSKGQYRLADRELGLHHQRLTQLIDRIAEGVHGEGDFAESRQLYVGGWHIVAVCRLHLPLER